LKNKIKRGKIFIYSSDAEKAALASVRVSKL